MSFAQDYNSKIQNYLDNNRQKLGLTQADISNWAIESTADSKTTGITNCYVKQNHQGIAVFNSTSNFWIKNDEVINADVQFINNLNSKINSTTPTLNAIQALNYAHESLNELKPIHEIIGNQDDKILISNGNLSDDPATAKLVFSSNGTTVKLAWDLTYYTQDFKHLWSIRIDATNGDLLEKQDWVISCNFGKSCTNHEHSFPFVKKESLFKTENSNMLQVQAGSYRVIPYNYESPNHSSFQLISNPSDATASPYGWHDTNGSNGAEYTITRGNNVLAQEDQNGNNGNGASPDGGASLLFDFTYGGTDIAASTYVDAATTNLFYMNNIMHDVFYHYGFTESTGNFQQNNYGNGGTQNDYVFADSQDGSGIDNANFSTPTDGGKPRMQMYLWDYGPIPYYLTVNSPSSLQGQYYAADNSFDLGHVNLPPDPGYTTNLVLYEDATPVTSDGCETAINAAQIAGNIVILRRGSCNFTVKVKNAQLAGAIAVIVVNNDNINADQYVGMGGSDATITIPAVSVTYNIGEALIAEMTNGPVNVTLKDDPNPFVNTDGDFDNGVIAHEYGHGISTRLTGGRMNSACLSSSEQMGEGWSDFFALIMQMKTGDTADDYRGIGTFVANEPTNGIGIRQYPYTPNMSINPFTFADTNSMWYTDSNGFDQVNVHAVGSVWATMLWDLTWAYIDKYGFDPDIYNGTGGNNKVLQLVVDALKLQPCNPSFISGRDAIIAADQATTNGEDYCMIWEVFARRGLGVNASSGTNSGVIGIQDQVEDFTTPAPGPNCVLSANYFENSDMFKVYPNPTNNNLNIRILNYSGKLNIQLFDINGRIVLDQNMNDFNIENTVNIQKLQSGIYMLKIEGENLNYTQKVIKE